MDLGDLIQKAAEGDRTAVCAMAEIAEWSKMLDRSLAQTEKLISLLEKVLGKEGRKPHGHDRKEHNRNHAKS
jgi:hypothetical protein